MDPRPTILILSASPLHRDPRVLTQIRALREEYDLVCMGLGRLDDKRVRFLGMHLIGNPLVDKIFRRLSGIVCREGFLRLGLFRCAYFFQSHVLATTIKSWRLKPDLILCNDINMLPSATLVKTRSGGGLYLDAHEYTPRQWDGDPAFKLWEPYWDDIMRRYSSAVDHMTTVCESIAMNYKRNYSLDHREIVLNVPTSFPDLIPTAVHEDRIRLVHHGVTNRNRQLEAMIRIVGELGSRFTLDFYLVTTDKVYLAELVNLAKDNDRIQFHDPVPTARIPEELNEYDIGLFPLSPLSANYRYALPNKFFEFIQARLAIAIWPSVEMKKIVEEHGLGIVTGDFSEEQMIERLRAITVDEIMSYKGNAHKAAPLYHSERSEALIRSGVRKCLGTTDVGSGPRSTGVGVDSPEAIR